MASHTPASTRPSRRHVVRLIGGSAAAFLIACVSDRRDMFAPGGSGGELPPSLAPGIGARPFLEAPQLPALAAPTPAPVATAAPLIGGAPFSQSAAIAPPTTTSALPPTRVPDRPAVLAAADTRPVQPAPPVARPPATATPAPPTATPVPTPLVYDSARLKHDLGVAQTSYAGGIAERRWNVELAANRLDGTLVAPGEDFSFNAAVGPMTLRAGFRVGYGITIRNDRPETVPSVAGGICQVATTVFQAAFWAGLPIVQRQYHFYWIPRYGQPPSGRVGLDATVDSPAPDLRFRNTTGDWIRLDSWVDSGNLGFIIRGVDPGWQVETTEPRVFDVVRANRTVVRQYDPSMAPGQELAVESAEDGFRLTMSRFVKLEGRVIDEYTFTNHYRPSRTVILTGTRPATATAVPSPTEVPGAEGPSPPTGPAPPPTGSVAPAEPAPSTAGGLRRVPRHGG